MKDQLEDFIRQNRTAFDDKEPPQRTWSRIERALFGSGTGSWWNSVVVWRAAAVVFMVVSGWLFLNPPQRMPKDQAVLSEFQDVERFYTQQISLKYQLIDQFPSAQGIDALTHDFQQLEAMYEVLREEMKTRPSKKVRDALILNLLVRINLLNQYIDRLEHDEEQEREGRASYVTS